MEKGKFIKILNGKGVVKVNNKTYPTNFKDCKYKGGLYTPIIGEEVEGVINGNNFVIKKVLKDKEVELYKELNDIKDRLSTFLTDYPSNLKDLRVVEEKLSKDVIKSLNTTVSAIIKKGVVMIETTTPIENNRFQFDHQFVDFKNRVFYRYSINS
jgi:hypothetical protein